MPYPVTTLRPFVYFSDREPKGYGAMLNRIGPKPMIELDKLRTEAAWIEAGRTVFEQMDHQHLRTQDSVFIELVGRGQSRVSQRQPRGSHSPGGERDVNTTDSRGATPLMAATR
jgi:hypothetical protein